MLVKSSYKIVARTISVQRCLRPSQTGLIKFHQISAKNFNVSSSMKEMHQVARMFLLHQYI